MFKVNINVLLYGFFLCFLIRIRVVLYGLRKWFLNLIGICGWFLGDI